jgi:hypothetical protein
MTKPILPLKDAQTLARLNNEQAAMHAAQRQRRRSRKKRKTKSGLSEKTIARLDRLVAERTARPTRAVGFMANSPHLKVQNSRSLHIRLHFNPVEFDGIKITATATSPQP